MSNYTRALFFALLISISIPQQTFAIGDAVSGIATGTVDLVKGVGQTVGQTVGIGVAATKIDNDVDFALDKLLKSSPTATELSEKAKAILVFPKILKAGLGIGGHFGEGALRKEGKTIAYYNTAAGS